MLQAADSAPVAAAFGLYAVCGHACEANYAGLSPRRLHVVVPPACRYSRAWVTRSGSEDPIVPASQAAHEHASATGGGYAGAAVSRQSSPVAGFEVYLQTAPVYPMTASAVVPTGSTINDAPAAAMDRALRVPEGLGASVELYEVRQVCGVGVQFFERTADLESL
ncbi:MAG: hypothetical protein FJ191_12720 [Gammaproteobacteria bacterium]|nr:hypothetical protein [Gammaproteobacteria bacterium]